MKLPDQEQLLMLAFGTAGVIIAGAFVVVVLEELLR
jgi:hypothetical protein